MYAVPSSGSQTQLFRVKRQSVRALSTTNIKYLFEASFVKRVIKSFSVTTHLFRGIMIIIRKSLRWGTIDPIKLY